jgi:hypothetical protein
MIQARVLKQIAFAILLAGLWSGCDRKPDFFPCNNVDCGQYGDCNDGDCDCNPGATKDADGKCTILERDKAIGSYTISAPGNCNNNTTGELVSGGAPMSISSGSGDNREISINIDNGVVRCNATVNGTSITIADQTYSGRKYSGTGLILTINNKTRIELTLIETDAFGVTCTYSIFGV